MADSGYVAIYLLIFLESVFPPLPSEIVLGFAGYMTTQTSLSVGWVIVTATLGAASGAMVFYSLGRFLRPSRFEALITKYERTLRLRYSDVERAEGWFRRYGPWTVLVCRVIPVLRSLISIPAGMAKMRPVPFIILTAIGATVWNTLLVSAGALLGDNWERIAEVLGTYSVFIYIAAAAAFAGLVVFYLRWRTTRPEVSE